MLKYNAEYAEPIKEIYFRTWKNCKFYEEQGDTLSLLNEIGVLRGVSYALDAINCNMVDQDLIRWCKLQEELKELGRKVM